LLQLARLSGGALVRMHWRGIAVHIVRTPPHRLRLTLITSTLVFGILTVGKLWSATEPAKDVVSWTRVGRRGPILWFFLGIFGGAIVRFFLGNFNAHDFAGGSAPIVAALLIAVLVPGPGNDEKGFSPPRQIAVMYLLIGAVAAAIGTFNAYGWILGLSFELILGGIATSIWLVWDILPSQDG
jgi:hypothetical protein